MYVQLYTKYKAYRKTLTSAEDFIDSAATRTIAGNTYYALMPDGSRKPLAEWLKEALEKDRQALDEKEVPREAR